MQFYSKQNKTPVQHILKSRLSKTATFINELSVPKMKKTSSFSLQFNKLNTLTPHANMIAGEPEYQNITMKTKYNQRTTSQDSLQEETPELIQECHFTVPDNFRSVIPLKIFQTWHSKELPPDMKAATEQLQAQNPEFEYHLYDDEMCRDFILKNYDADVLYAYDKLKPGAYKADLWRYCVMYKYGGVYLDIKFRCINDFRLLLLSDKEYFVKDLKWDGVAGIYQALFSCLPGNEIMLKCIKQTVENVKNEWYGTNSLSICGPQMISAFFTQTDLDNLEYKLFKNNQIVCIPTRSAAMTPYENYRKEQNLFQKGTHYAIHWENKDVYNTLPDVFQFGAGRNRRCSLTNILSASGEAIHNINHENPQKSI
jgi:mannosyltransferase OCH1-like enzyme